jgi:hypothetical protein
MKRLASRQALAAAAADAARRADAEWRLDMALRIVITPEQQDAARRGVDEH